MIKIKDTKAVIFYFLMSIIFLDFGNQIRKLSYFPSFENINNSVFQIVHLNNTGSAFNLFQNHTLFLSIFGIIAIIFAFIYVMFNLSFKKDKLVLFSITIFSGGTLGNLIERLHLGHVVDYIKLNFINFPVFNAFDIMICTGIFLYTIYVLFDNSDKVTDKNGNNQNNL